MSAMAGLMCDECGTKRIWNMDYHAFYDATKLAIDDGWTVKRTDGSFRDRHICPDCSVALGYVDGQRGELES